MPSDVRRSCLECQADIQLFRLSLTIAVYKTMPTVIGKEDYVQKHDFLRKNHRRCVKIGLTLKKQLFNKMSQNVLKLTLQTKYILILNFRSGT